MSSERDDRARQTGLFGDGQHPGAPREAKVSSSQGVAQMSHAELAAHGDTSRPWLWLVAFGLLLLVAVVAFAGARSYRDLTAARQRADELEAQIRDTEARVRDLGRRIEWLREDPALLERLAREELGLVSPDEVVIVLPEDGP